MILGEMLVGVIDEDDLETERSVEPGRPTLADLLDRP
jgi:hypothetical protein